MTGFLSYFTTCSDHLIIYYFIIHSNSLITTHNHCHQVKPTPSLQTYEQKSFVSCCFHQWTLHVVFPFCVVAGLLFAGDPTKPSLHYESCLHVLLSCSSIFKLSRYEPVRLNEWMKCNSLLERYVHQIPVWTIERV